MSDKNINISDSNLSEADLSEADLSEADLSEADLSDADPSYTGPRYEKIIRCNNLESVFQHKITDLIKELTSYLEKEGDIPVIYWDKECACKFDKFADFCDLGKLESTNNKVLMLGDFHVEGCNHMCKYLRLQFKPLNDNHPKQTH